MSDTDNGFQRGGAEAQRLNGITEKVIGICIDIHKELGPGLLESAYEACLYHALNKQGMRVKRQVSLPLQYDGVNISAGYKIDLLVEESVIIELKSVASILAIHEAQLLTYLRLANLSLGLLINFNVPLLRQGIRRLVNNFVESSAPLRLRVEKNTTKRRDVEMQRGLDEVKATIPHREPFLFIDRIIERGEDSIVTEREVRADEPQFQGHYPGSPLMPGVLLCEACFQTGAILLAGDDKNVMRAPRPHLPAEVNIRYRGRLPHWETESGIYFVTWRLADSLPEKEREKIRQERLEIVKTAEVLSRPLSDAENLRLERLHTERIEELLNSGYGSCSLSDNRCAGIVAETLEKFDGDRYDLHAWVVMPNHVHVVFQAKQGHDLSSIMHSWKSYTAKACNKILARTGKYWMDESFDRLVRDSNEHSRFVEYVLGNPSQAGLIDWKWIGVGAGGAPTSRKASAGEVPTSQPPKKPVLTRILEAKFRGMVIPGDVMRIEVSLDEKMGEAFVMSGKILVNSKVVLRVKFIVAMVELADK